MGLSLVPLSIIEASKLLRGKEDIFSHTFAFGVAGLGMGFVFKQQGPVVLRLTAMGVGFGAMATLLKEITREGKRDGNETAQWSAASLEQSLRGAVDGLRSQFGWDEPRPPAPPAAKDDAASKK